MLRLIFAGVLMLQASIAAAHEVKPAIGDMTFVDGVLALDLRLGAEPLIAGVDLDGVEDTNAVEGSAAVDALRALEPAALEAALQERLPEILPQIGVSVDGTPVTWRLQSVEAGPVGDVDLPRETALSLVADMPEAGRMIEVVWPASFGTLILRQQGVEAPFTGYLSGGASSGPFAIEGGGAMTGWSAFWYYIAVGFDHIVPQGLDHILFVLALFFLSSKLSTLLWQVSAFTLAHTVTLALGALGLVNIPASIVEPIIAASIVFVAVENMLSDRLNRWRPLVIFGFGLLHGLGFASVLGAFGLPDAQFVPALIGFNVGVEVGQLAVIAVTFLVVWCALKVDRGDIRVGAGQVAYAGAAVAVVLAGLALLAPEYDLSLGVPLVQLGIALLVLIALCLVSVTLVDRLEAYRRFVAIPASGLIACIGAYWVIERVFL